LFCNGVLRKVAEKLHSVTAPQSSYRSIPLYELNSQFTT